MGKVITIKDIEDEEELHKTLQLLLGVILLEETNKLLKFGLDLNKALKGELEDEKDKRN